MQVLARCHGVHRHQWLHAGSHADVPTLLGPDAHALGGVDAVLLDHVRRLRRDGVARHGDLVAALLRHDDGLAVALEDGPQQADQAP